MAEITAGMVKELREKSGAGMMDCKKALVETDGDMDAAVDWLRKKGLSAAAKKAGRVAAEGLVGVAAEGTLGAIVEVNAETDFVARNESFQEFVAEVSKLALHHGEDLEALKAASYPGNGTVEEKLVELIATIGENMSLRRVATISVEQGAVGAYVHNQVAPGLGKIGVLVGIESAGDQAKIEEFGKQVAMHVAATQPQSVSVEDLDPEIVERERSILAEQARASGKPEEIIEKMVEGRLRKFYEESVLLEQTFVIDGENKVKKAVEAISKEAGGEAAIGGFVRFQLGEGIEKQDSDFAAEVAAQLS